MQLDCELDLKQPVFRMKSPSVVPEFRNFYNNSLGACHVGTALSHCAFRTEIRCRHRRIDRENSVGNIIFKTSSARLQRPPLRHQPKQTIQGSKAYKSIEEIGAASNWRSSPPAPDRAPTDRTMRPQRCPQRHHHHRRLLESGPSAPPSSARCWRSPVPTTCASWAPTVSASSAPELGLNATFAKITAKAGNLALVSQSGAMCSAVLDWAKANRSASRRSFPSA